MEGSELITLIGFRIYNCLFAKKHLLNVRLTCYGHACITAAILDLLFIQNTFKCIDKFSPLTHTHRDSFIHQHVVSVDSSLHLTSTAAFHLCLLVEACRYPRLGEAKTAKHLRTDTGLLAFWILSHLTVIEFSKASFSIHFFK